MRPNDPLESPEPPPSDMQRLSVKLRYPLVFLGSLLVFVAAALAGSYAIRSPGEGRRVYEEPHPDLGESVNVSPVIRRNPMGWELRQLREQERTLLETFARLDDDPPLYRIPIELAMRWIASEGKPGPPPSPESGGVLRIEAAPGGRIPREEAEAQGLTPDEGNVPVEQGERLPQARGPVDIDRSSAPAGGPPIGESEKEKDR